MFAFSMLGTEGIALATWLYFGATVILAGAAIVAGFFAKKQLDHLQEGLKVQAASHQAEMTALSEQQWQAVRPAVLVRHFNPGIGAIKAENAGAGPAVTVLLRVWGVPFTPSLENGFDAYIGGHRREIEQRPPDLTARLRWLNAGSTATAKARGPRGNEVVENFLGNKEALVFRATFTDLFGREMKSPWAGTTLKAAEAWDVFIDDE